MIDQFGQVIVYVKNPMAAADFWVNKIGFVERTANTRDDKVISVEVAPNSRSDTGMVLFDREIAAKAEPELSLGTPSILFSSYDLEAMRRRLIEEGVTAGKILTTPTMKTFNFADPEGNYFAVREIAKG